MNKLIAAVLLTILLIFGIGKISETLFYVKKPDQAAYKVEGTDSASTTESKSSSKIDISSFLALGSVEDGKKVFKKCVACHSVVKGGGNKIGPKLYNIVGRKAASVSDYKYSKALSSYNKGWSFEELNGFLLKPSTWIKGNKMGFAGLKKEKDRASVILYLNQNSDNPKTLP